MIAETFPMTNLILTRRELALRALAGAAGAMLLASPTEAQVVDQTPAIPPLPITPAAPSEGQLLIQLVPLVAGYALTDTQTREVALQLKDYPGDFASARSFVIPDEIGPAFAADAPMRKERTR